MQAQVVARVVCTGPHSKGKCRYVTFLFSSLDRKKRGDLQSDLPEFTFIFLMQVSKGKRVVVTVFLLTLALFLLLVDGQEGEATDRDPAIVDVAHWAKTQVERP